MKPTNEQLASFSQLTGKIVAMVIRANPAYVELSPFTEYMEAVVRCANAVAPSSAQHVDMDDIFVIMPEAGSRVIRNTVTVDRLAQVTEQAGNLIALLIQKNTRIIETEEFASFAATGLSFALIGVLQDDSLAEVKTSEEFQEFLLVATPILAFLQE